MIQPPLFWPEWKVLTPQGIAFRVFIITPWTEYRWYKSSATYCHFLVFLLHTKCNKANSLIWPKKSDIRGGWGSKMTPQNYLNWTSLMYLLVMSSSWTFPARAELWRFRAEPGYFNFWAENELKIPINKKITNFLNSFFPQVLLSEVLYHDFN